MPRDEKTQANVNDLFACLLKDLGFALKDMETCLFRAEKEGLAFLTKTLPLLCKALDRGIASQHFDLPTNFKKMRTGWRIPALFGSAFRRVFDRQGHLLDDYCVVAVYQIRQACLFINKCDMPYDSDQVNKVIQSFERNEADMEFYNENLSIEANSSVHNLASQICHDIFHGFSPEDLLCKHGPGATSNCGTTEKYDARMSPHMGVYRRFGKHFWFNPEDGFSRLHRYPVSTTLDYFKSSQCAKVVLVPKDSRGPRLISCEPVENQFVQQGIMSWMISRLGQHPLTRGQVNFNDQSVNQRLAVEASLTKQWATLDMKDASDRVSLKLVSLMFKSLPGFYSALLESRSTHTVLPTGKRHLLHKFAPMGSALCFPVLATSVFVYAYIGLIANGVSPDEACRSIFVFGDDLIVPSTHAPFLMSFIEHHTGLRFNREKSFINSSFAESCGVDAVRGNNVTPVRLRKWIINEQESSSPQTLVSLLATANLLVGSGCFSTAEYLYSLVESQLGPLPYGSSTANYLCRLTTCTSIPEKNYLDKRLKRYWRTESNLARYPLGRSLRVIRVKPVTKYQEETFYGRQMRIWPLLGMEDIPLPEVHVFAEPRKLELVRGRADHYDMS